MLKIGSNIMYFCKWPEVCATIYFGVDCGTNRPCGGVYQIAVAKQWLNGMQMERMQYMSNNVCHHFTGIIQL